MTGRSAATAPERSRLSARFSAHDLVNVAIFAVIFIVVTYAIGMLGVISPVVWLIALPVTAVIDGIPFMLFLTRVRHAGMVTLFGLIVGLFYLLTGNTIVSTAVIVLLGVAAEVVLFAGRYRSRWAAIGAYVVFGLAFVSPFLPLFYDREGYFSMASWGEMGEEYTRAADALLSAPVIGILAAVVLVAGFVGGVLGSAVLRKHFVRAGLA